MTSPLSMIIVGVILSKVIKDNSMITSTMILLSAMPAAVMTSIFSENFNKEYASMFVFVTTLFSIVTFPIIVKLIT